MTSNKINTKLLLNMQIEKSLRKSNFNHKCFPPYTKKERKKEEERNEYPHFFAGIIINKKENYQKEKLNCNHRIIYPKRAEYHKKIDCLTLHQR